MFAFELTAELGMGVFSILALLTMVFGGAFSITSTKGWNDEDGRIDND